MSDIEVVQRDNKPSIVGHLTNPDGTDFDLTNCTVKFQMRLPRSFTYEVDAAGVVTDAPHGMVRYDWGNNDLLDPGDYQCQWQIAFTGGGIQTTDPANSITVRRE